MSAVSASTYWGMYASLMRLCSSGITANSSMFMYSDAVIVLGVVSMRFNLVLHRLRWTGLMSSMVFFIRTFFQLSLVLKSCVPVSCLRHVYSLAIVFISVFMQSESKMLNNLLSLTNVLFDVKTSMPVCMPASGL